MSEQWDLQRCARFREEIAASLSLRSLSRSLPSSLPLSLLPPPFSSLLSFPLSPSHLLSSPVGSLSFLTVLMLASRAELDPFAVQRWASQAPRTGNTGPVKAHGRAPPKAINKDAQFRPDFQRKAKGIGAGVEGEVESETAAK
jgi:hypothetical protein